MKMEKLIDELYEMFLQKEAKRLGYEIDTPEKKERFIITAALTQILSKS